MLQSAVRASRRSAPLRRAMRTRPPNPVRPSSASLSPAPLTAGPSSRSGSREAVPLSHAHVRSIVIQAPGPSGSGSSSGSGRVREPEDSTIGHTSDRARTDPRAPRWEIIEASPPPHSYSSSSASASASSSDSGVRSKHPFADHIDPATEPAASSIAPLSVIDRLDPRSGSAPGAGLHGTGEGTASPSSSGSASPSTSLSTTTPTTTPSPSPSPSPGSHPSTLPAPPAPTPPTRPLHLQHPFDTHAFVTYLTTHAVPPPTAEALMQAVRQLIVRRGELARESMLGREEMENGAYLFKAALSELRTELSVRARNDGMALRAMSGAIRREVDGLEVKMKEDVTTLRHDIEMDMNNRKADIRTDLKGFDMAIEEINNKFTISLGDLRTEIESAKWDSTRRAISIIILVVVFGVAVTMYNTPAPAPASAASSSSAKTATASTSTSPGSSSAASTREIGVGTDDLFSPDDIDVESLSDEKLDRILRERGLGEIMVRPRAERVVPVDSSRRKEISVDRI